MRPGRADRVRRRVGGPARDRGPVERGRGASPPGASGGPPEGRGSALPARLGVALVGLPAVALLLALPAPLFMVVLALLAAVGAGELLRASGGGAGAVASAGAAASALVAALSALDREASAAALAVAALGLLAALSRADGRRASLLWWAAGLLYVGVGLAHAPLIRMEPEGQRWLLVLLAGVFATDTGAYAVGRPLGRRLLAPRLSPGKTWEGTAGGLVCGALAVLAAAAALDLPAAGGEAVGRAQLAQAALAIPAAALAGDLLASAIKRRLGRKDFSRLLPGHGGLLDRMDSLLLAAPTLYLLVAWSM